MRRLVAFVLAQALVAASAVGSSLHVHEYLGHDHPDHHHGPAAHDHQQSTFADRDDHELGLQSDSCDPGRHAVSVSTTCASVTQVRVDLAELPGPRIVILAVPIQSTIPITDVRVHGPPFDARILSRGPPVMPPA